MDSDQDVKINLLAPPPTARPCIVSNGNSQPSLSLRPAPPTAGELTSQFGDRISDECHGIQLTWSNLSFTVQDSSINPFHSSESKTRTLIHNLNGSIRNGQLTAIIGPSGAGKTTLIECLAGRRISGLKGDVRVKYNG